MTHSDDLLQRWAELVVRFAANVQQLELGAWSQPLASVYGLHLVRIAHRSAARLPTLAEVRTRVERDWAHDQRRMQLRAALRRLRARYRITVERPS